MKIEFTKDQYENLLKMAYLGNWMINAFREENETTPEYEQLEEYLLKHAKDFDLEHLAIEDSGNFFPSADLEADEEMDTYMDEYKDEVFWEQLAYRLSLKDLLNKFGEEELNDMEPEKRFLLISNLEEQYNEELYRTGLENVSIKDFEPSFEEAV